MIKAQNYERILLASERFADDIGLQPEDFNTFCMGLMRLLRSMPKDPLQPKRKPKKKRK